MSQQHLDEMAPWGDTEYRAPKPLSFELVQHIGIFFEEKLYTQALNLLFNVLASGSYAARECIIPQPPHLAIAATFLVHPSTTTRANSPEEDVAYIALRLLRLLGTLVSPREAKLDIAFSFTHDNTLRSGGHYHVGQSSYENPGYDENMPLNDNLGKEESLWSRADDFWHAVGWAFNCSVRYPGRWERWRIWLEFMHDVLQDDWNERERIFQEKKDPRLSSSGAMLHAQNKKGTLDQYQDFSTLILRESLIFQYISSSGKSSNNRRIFRAVFADGGSVSRHEFREVFHDELKPPKSKKTNEKAKKRERDVNIDKEEYGDYLAQDESDGETTAGAEVENFNSRSSSPSGAGARRSKRTRRGTRNAKDSSDNGPIDGITGPDQAVAQHDVDVSLFGGLDSLDLRKRLLGLLSRVSEHLPRQFMSILELNLMFVENIRHMPLPIFQAFICPYVLPGLFDKPPRYPQSDRTQRLDEAGKNIHGQRSDAEQTTLCELLLFNMIESAAPHTDQEYLDQDKLEECFLPFAAANASVVDNAKVSILLEALMVLLAGNGTLELRPSLQNAVQIGLSNRVERASDENRRSQAKKQQESLEWSWLMESGDRLLFLMEVL